MTAHFLSPLFRFLAGWTLHWAIFLAGPVLILSSSAYAQEISVFDGDGTLPADERVDNQGTHFFTGNGQTHPFTIKNTGLAALSGLRWDIIGPAAADFVLDSSSSAALAPGATASFSVTFTSAALGARVGIIRIFSNDPDENPFEIILSGTGGSPEISIIAASPGSDTLLENSRVHSWGANITTPVGLSSVQAIAAGGSHTVALKADDTVVAWGANGDGQTTTPPGLSSVQAIAAGGSHTVALKADGTVVAWGANGSGQTTIPPGLSNVQAITAGNSHTVALKNDGTVVAWGANGSGQTTIPPGLSSVQAIVAGDSYTVALKDDGTVVAWGWNQFGQLNIPVGLSRVKAIAAGRLHTVALKDDGTVVAWGDNGNGQKLIPAGLSGVQAIAAGIAHTVALRADGTVVAWGWDFYGQTRIPTGLSGVQAISAGGTHTVALTGSEVGLGNQKISTSSEPKSFFIKNTGTAKLNIAGVTVTGRHAQDFRVNTGGMATALPAVDGQTSFSVTFTPTGSGFRQARIQVVSDDPDEGIFDFLLTGFSPFDADIAVFDGSITTPADERLNHLGTRIFPATLLGKSLSQTFTIKNTGPSDSLSNFRWDFAGSGASDFNLTSLGTNALAPNATTTFSVAFSPKALGTRVATLRIFSNDFDENPFEINLSGTGVTPEISIEDQAVTPFKNNRILAWGDNRRGQTDIPAGLSAVQAIAAGQAHTVALRVDGTVVAWGSTPFATPIGLSNVRAITALVALKEDGTVVSFNPNDSRIFSGVQAIASGQAHTVALKADGTVFAWGNNAFGESTIPVGLSRVKAIAAAQYHTVALKDDGTVVAWGWNQFGQLNIPVGLSRVKAIAAGLYHTVALKDDGTVVAWGDNGNGQTLIPVGLSGVQAIAAGIAHTVALREDGSIVAWGWDIYGQTRIPTGLSGVQAVSAGGTHTVVLQGPKVVFASGRPEKFTLTNTGSAPLQIADVRISGENAGDFTVSTLGMLTSIPPVSGQTTFTVTFHPSKSGTKTANLLVKSDDLDEGDYFIWLTGTNNQPQAVGTIPEHEIRIGTPLTVDLSSYFIDPDGGRLSYSLLTNSNSAAITATLTGSALQLSGLAPGLTDITLLASDTPGGSITSTLRVRAVNEFTVPSPAPELTVSQTARLADGSVLVQINAIPGRSYQVETSPNLNQWTPVPLPIQAGATKVQYIDHDAPPESLKRYYRVREISW